MKGVARQPRTRQGRDSRRGTRNGHYLDTGFAAGTHERVPGIGNQRHAGIADQGDALPLPQQFEQEEGPGCLVVFVIALPRRVDAVVSQEPRRVTRVFARNQVHFSQDAERPERKVLQIADGRPNDEEPSATRSASFTILRHSRGSLRGPG